MPGSSASVPGEAVTIRNKREPGTMTKVCIVGLGHLGANCAAELVRLFAHAFRKTTHNHHAFRIEGASLRVVARHCYGGDRTFV